MKKVMVVAGGKWQVPLIKYIKSRGHYVVNTNLYENSPGFVHADEHYVVDVLDKERNLEIAEQCNIDAITSDQSDIAIFTVAYIAEMLGLSGIGTKSANLFTNKYEMRLRGKELGLPTPKFELCHTLQDAELFLRHHKKVVIKPPDGQGSRCVFIVSNDDFTKNLFEIALSESKCDAVLLEEYIEGYELTVEGYKTTDKHVTLAISEKSRIPNHPQVASNLWYSVAAFKKHKMLIKEHNALIENFTLPFGLTHSEYIYNDGTYTLVETAARGGGTNISSHIVPCISGVNVYEELCRNVLGQKSQEICELEPNCSIVLDFFQLAPGRVKSIKGMETLLCHPSVLDAALNFQAGDFIPTLSDDTSRAGYIIARAKDDEELRKLLPTLKNELQVLYE